MTLSGRTPAVLKRFRTKTEETMNLSDPLILATVLSALLSLIFLFVSVLALRKKKVLGTAIGLLLMLLMFSLGALFGTISLAIQGYRALTREDLAATVKLEPIGPQRFMATVSLPGGGQQTFSLAGDELYIDAHILKWKPWANILGLHTSYELDRVAGRYTVLADETTKPRTVYSLSRDKPVDMFMLRKKLMMLNPLLDAEYGSATYIATSAAEEFKVLVSTSGLLIRKNDAGAEPPRPVN